VISRINAALRIDLPLSTFFGVATVAEFAKRADSTTRVPQSAISRYADLSVTEADQGCEGDGR